MLYFFNIPITLLELVIRNGILLQKPVKKVVKIAIECIIINIYRISYTTFQ